jgi:hypothetical protein
MRPTWRAGCLIAIAVAGLATTTSVAAASASSHRGTAHAPRSCIKVTATIPVGNFPSFTAVNPKTKTVYVPNLDGSTVSVINGRTNGPRTTVRAPYVPG